MSNLKFSFEPIIGENSTILILGTLPGDESLLRKEYYANKSNQFWSIIYRIFGKEEIDKEYEVKKNFLLDNKIALWDVYLCGEREGSSDSKIKDGKPNDIEGLLQKYSNIKRIILNSKKAEKVYLKYFSALNIDIFYVPSPSRAFTKPIDEKIIIWKKALTD